MKIGVYFTPYKEQSGVYRYAVAILEALDKISRHKYVVITTSPDVPLKFKRSKKFKIINMASKSRQLGFGIRDMISYLIAKLAPGLINFLYKKKLFGIITFIYKRTELPKVKVIEKENMDLVFYPTSSNLSFLTSTPAIVTVHDLQHRLHPRFKEVSAGGRWEYREYGFINIAKNSFRIFVDSEIGKEDMVGFYPKSKGRVAILPYLPPSYINPRVSFKNIKNAKTKYNLPDKFIFYPAKFWPHKNHKNIIRAMSYLKKKGKVINLVLTGSKDADFSSFDEVMKLADKTGIKNQIFYLGHVENEELSAIYKLADALIMPTYFGPTNIPVLEAWKMGTPVLYSDIRGCRQQLGDAGLLINPDKPIDIANKIVRIYDQPQLSSKLAQKGKNRIKRWTDRDFSKKIDQTIKEFEKSRSGNRNN